MPLNKINCAQLLSTGETNPFTFDKLLSEFIPQWIQWEPETIWAFFRSFTRRKPDFGIKTKVNTMKFLHNSESAWKDWEGFCAANDGLNNKIPDFEILNKPSINNIYVTVWALQTLRPEEAFSEEIKRFLTAACLDAGILFVPPPLDFIQNLLDVTEYKCTLCGNIDIYDNNRCDACGATEASLILVPRYFDWKEVKSKWEEIKGKSLEQVELKENLIDIHLYKLLDAYASLAEYKAAHRKEMVDAVS